jgi:hypothetical protein
MSDPVHDPIIRVPAGARIREFETRFAPASPEVTGWASRAHRELSALLDHPMRDFSLAEVA